MSSHANVGFALPVVSRWVAQGKLNFVQDEGNSYLWAASGAFHAPPSSNLSLKSQRVVSWPWAAWSGRHRRAVHYFLSWFAQVSPRHQVHEWAQSNCFPSPFWRWCVRCGSVSILGFRVQGDLDVNSSLSVTTESPFMELSLHSPGFRMSSDRCVPPHLTSITCNVGAKKSNWLLSDSGCVPSGEWQRKPHIDSPMGRQYFVDLPTLGLFGIHP